MTIIDGKKVSQKICDVLKTKVQKLQSHHIVPKLAIVQIGANPASNVYVRNKIRLGDSLAITTNLHKLPVETTNTALLDLITKLNNDVTVNGILVQMPLPSHIDEANVIAHIDPNKDVDCFHLSNIGKL
jgi:methylenetetrahydrofolate dehydrogenase (NADP+)/methenyltetrahydrofolate cyclohydrolase